MGRMLFVFLKMCSVTKSWLCLFSPIFISQESAFLGQNSPLPGVSVLVPARPPTAAFQPPRPPLRLPASGLCVALPLPGCGSPFPPQPQAVRASGRHPQKVLRPVPVPGGQLVLTLSYLSGLQLSFGFYVLCMNLCRYNIQYVLCIDLDEWFLSVSSPR